MTITVLSKEDTRQIQLLTERRNSLNELILILTNSEDCNLLYTAQADLKETECRISKWWQDILLQNDRSINDAIHYKINFSTRELSALID